MMNSEALLEVKDLVFSQNGVTLLDGISFSLYRGDNIAFFGPEGSGLVELVSILLGFEDSYGGDVRYGGRLLREFDYAERHYYKREIGYLHGDYGLISNMSVQQNISLPLEYHSRMSSEDIQKRVASLIDALNLDHCKKLRPVDLSPSEVLRTAYARSIAMDPDVLYIEHAFESQSLVNIRTFLDNLKMRVRQPDKAVLFVTYEPEKVIDLVDRYVMFFNGRIVFEGDRGDFLSNRNAYLRQFRQGDGQGPMVIL